MALTTTQLLELYRRRAGHYDLAANLYYLIGFREVRYRKMAVEALSLRPGDMVVELGCGTGLNFGHLLAAVGGTGRVIGVDLTDAMLDKARQRVAKHGWQNVTLVRSDAADYVFTPGINGVISTFALTLVPGYQQVVGQAARALAPGGRMVVLDFRKPDRWPLWVIELAVWLTRPFGVSLDLSERKPWVAMARHFPDVSLREYYGGFVYVATGMKPALPAPHPPKRNKEPPCTPKSLMLAATLLTMHRQATGPMSTTPTWWRTSAAASGSPWP